MTWEEFVAACIPEPATVLVEAYAGAGAHGDVYAAPVEVTPCVVEDTRRLVRVQTQDTAGAEQLSSTTVYVPLATVAPANSRVTVAGRPPAKVLRLDRLDDHGLGLPSHLELSLE